MDIFLEGLKSTSYAYDENDPQIKPFNIDKHTGHPFPHSEESKKLMSEVKKGKHDSAYYSELAKKRIDFKQTDYQKQRVREHNESAWVVTPPGGQPMNIVNLRKFSIENGLDQGNMVKVSQGILKQHKGYTCYKVA
jgi:hypothetical protein